MILYWKTKHFDRSSRISKAKWRTWSHLKTHAQLEGCLENKVSIYIKVLQAMYGNTQ